MIDFDRLNDDRQRQNYCNIDDDGTTLFTLLPSWRDAIVQILNLPISTYSHPLSLTGEFNDKYTISTITPEEILSRLETIKRQAKGNNMNDYDLVMSRLGNTKPVNSFDAYLPVGEHQLIVHSITEYNDATHGKSYRGTFFIENSNSQSAIGTLGTRIWNINKTSQYPTQANDADSLVDFICQLTGQPLGQHQNSARAMLVPANVVNGQNLGGNAESQPARGCRIMASVRAPGQGLTRAGKPKTYTPIKWSTAPNDATSIGTNRAMLDSKFPMGAPRQMPVQPAPQPQYAPPAQPQYAPPAQPQYAPPVTQVPAGGFLQFLPPKQ